MLSHHRFRDGGAGGGRGRAHLRATCHGARWLPTSNHSPLTGEMLAHSELVPNYLLLSSLGNNNKVESECVLDSEYVNNV